MRLVSILTAIALIGFSSGCTFIFGESPSTTVVEPVEPAPGGTAVGAPTGEESDSDLASRFLSSGWRYCDAVVLGGFWGQDSWEAKVRAGRKIAWGDRDILEGMVDQARSQARAGQGARCSFADSGYSFADARALAMAWSTDIAGVKAMVEDKILWGSYDSIDAAIASTRGGTAGQPEGDADERAMRAFFDSDRVDYCHAKMLSGAWSNTLSQSKVILGHKVLNRNFELLEQTLDEARGFARSHPEARCEWADVGFEYQDAADIAAIWGVSVEDAKTSIAEKYLYGSEGNVRELLAQQRRRR